MTTPDGEHKEVNQADVALAQLALRFQGAGLTTTDCLRSFRHRSQCLGCTTAAVVTIMAGARIIKTVMQTQYRAAMETRQAAETLADPARDPDRLAVPRQQEEPPHRSTTLHCQCRPQACLREGWRDPAPFPMRR
mmetsp:Transcript_64370/g.119666  ORF Transcript_64370/g.119666 Transcript_64370/m.119666 type:complete len:135 (-) Transcript_64370:137-541(-)